MIRMRRCLGLTCAAAALLFSACLLPFEASAAPPSGKGGGNDDGGGSDDGGTTPDVSYTMTLLRPETAAWSAASGMNNLGDVVGRYEDQNRATGASPFFYSAETGMISPIDALVDEQSLWDPNDPADQDGWYFTSAVGVNDIGQITGEAYLNVSGTYELTAYRLNPPAEGEVYWSIESIEPVPGARFVVTAINNDGDVTGWFNGETPYLFLWTSAGQLENLRTGSDKPHDITDRDSNGSFYIAGERYGPQAWRYTYPVGFDLLADSWSKAYGVNSLGEVTGYAPTGARSEHQAFRYTDAGGMVFLGSFNPSKGGNKWTDSEGRSINAQGHIVGVAAEGEFPAMGAFLHTHEFGMVNLADLIPGLDPDLRQRMPPIAINDAGMILGNIDDGAEAYLLVPNP